MEEDIRLVIVEDDGVLRQNLEECLSAHGGFDILGAYASAEACLEAGRLREAEILLLDMELPGMSGLQLIEHIHQNRIETRVAVFTNHDDRQLVFQAIQAGAQGYVLKGSSLNDISEKLKSLKQGEAPVSPSIAMMLLESLGPNSRSENDALSMREIELLNLLAKGMQYKEAGPQMGISEHTVHSHVKRIYGKLNVVSRGQAIRKARLLGLVKEESAD
jgi:DNA-binding NarL/FixJ family response regulator